MSRLIRWARRPRLRTTRISIFFLILLPTFFSLIFFSSSRSAVPIKRLEAAPVCTLTTGPIQSSVCCCCLPCWQPATSLKLFNAFYSGAGVHLSPWTSHEFLSATWRDFLGCKVTLNFSGFKHKEKSSLLPFKWKVFIITLSATVRQRDRLMPLSHPPKSPTPPPGDPRLSAWICGAAISPRQTYRAGQETVEQGLVSPVILRGEKGVKNKRDIWVWFEALTASRFCWVSHSVLLHKQMNQSRVALCVVSRRPRAAAAKPWKAPRSPKRAFALLGVTAFTWHLGKTVCAIWL